VDYGGSRRLAAARGGSRRLAGDRVRIAAIRAVCHLARWLLRRLYLWPMPVKARAPMMASMRSPLSPRRIVLVPAGSSQEHHGQPAIRRYRVARLRFDTPRTASAKPYEYLKRTFD
jgi:hypothetical protein